MDPAAFASPTAEIPFVDGALRLPDGSELLVLDCESVKYFALRLPDGGYLRQPDGSIKTFADLSSAASLLLSLGGNPFDTAKNNQ